MGVLHIVNSVMSRAALGTSHAVGLAYLPTCFNGQFMRLPADVWTSLYSRYEPYNAQIISQHLRKGDFFLDIGAHHGLWSLFAAKLVGKRNMGWWLRANLPRHFRNSNEPRRRTLKFGQFAWAWDLARLIWNFLHRAILLAAASCLKWRENPTSAILGRIKLIARRKSFDQAGRCGRQRSRSSTEFHED